MNSEWMKRLGSARTWIVGVAVIVVVVVWIIQR
jgi:hypothetical protein